MRKSEVRYFFVAFLVIALSGCTSGGYVRSNIPGVAAGLTAVRDTFVHQPCRGDHVQLRARVEATAELRSKDWGFLSVDQSVSSKRDCVSKEVRNE